MDLSDSSESTIFYQKDLFNQGFPMMENIRREGKLCDVNIMVGEHSLQGHRIVLAANIPYFRAMFTHDMAESRQPNITMHSIDPSAAESLINFAYTGRVTISTSNVQNLMMGASFLQLSKVRDACAEFLQVRLSPQNVLGIRTFAERVGSINLVKSSDKFLQKHFKAVSESEEFLGVGLEDVSELVGRDELHVISEEVVFLATSSETSFSPKSRNSSDSLTALKCFCRNLSENLTRLMLTTLSAKVLMPNTFSGESWTCRNSAQASLTLLSWRKLAPIIRFCPLDVEMATLPV